MLRGRRQPHPRSADRCPNGTRVWFCSRGTLTTALFSISLYDCQSRRSSGLSGKLSGLSSILCAATHWRSPPGLRQLRRLGLIWLCAPTWVWTQCRRVVYRTPPSARLSPILLLRNTASWPSTTISQWDHASCRCGFCRRGYRSRTALWSN